MECSRIARKAQASPEFVYFQWLDWMATHRSGNLQTKCFIKFIF